MKKMKTRILAILVAVSMVTSGMATPLTVRAQESVVGEPAGEEMPISEESEETPAPEIEEGGENEETPVPEIEEGGESEETPAPEVEEGGAGEETPAPESEEGGAGEENPTPESEEGEADEETPTPEAGEAGAESPMPSEDEENLNEEELSEELLEEELAEELLPEEEELTGDGEVPDDSYVGTIDTYEFDGDASGTGWSWDQETATLTLTDATIDASADGDYTAIRMCEGSTLVSAGTANKIIAPTGEWGMDIYGSVTITGDAPLTIEGCSSGIGSDGVGRLTIDGTPVTITGENENEAALAWMHGVSADRALLLNGGAYIATAGVHMLPYEEGSNYYHSYAGSSREDGYASDLEIKVAEDYINLDVIPAETYSGKAADAELSLTMTAQASSSTEDPVTYQWYSCDDYAHTNPVEISGATSASYTFSGSQTAGDYYFFCKATAGSMSREFPVSKIILNTKGMLPVNKDYFEFYDTTPSEDQLATYGWKWDKATKTLTLQNAEINGQLYFYLEEGDITIQLPEDSVSTVNKTTSYSVLSHNCDDDSNLIISGGGTLNVTRNNSSSNAYSYGVIDVENGLVISNGAQVNVSAIGTGKCGGLSAGTLQVKDTAKLTLQNITPSIDVTNRDYAAAAYQKLLGTKITLPESYTIEEYNGQSYVKDASGYATKVVFEVGTDPYYDITSQPVAVTQTKSGDATATFSLTVAAAAYNGAPAPSYQWYTCDEDGESKVAIEGATSATYTHTGSIDIGAHYYCAEVTGAGSTGMCSKVAVVYASPTGNALIANDAVYLYSNSNFEPKTPTAGFGVTVDEVNNKWLVELENATAFVSDTGIYINNNSGLNRDTDIILTGDNYIYADYDAVYSYIASGEKITFQGDGSLSMVSKNEAIDLDNSNVIIEDNATVSIECKKSVVNEMKSLVIKEDGEFSFSSAAGLWFKTPSDCDFAVEGVEGAYINAGGYLVDTDGNKLTSAKLITDTATKLVITDYPEATVNAKVGTPVSLTVAAELRNYTGEAPALKYQWYVDGVAKEGATSATFTYTPAVKKNVSVHCVVSTEYGGQTYSVTGTAITLDLGIITKTLTISTSKASTDMLDTQGWKWDKDAKTLTFDGVAFDTESYALNLSGSAGDVMTLVLAEDSVNTIAKTGSTSAYAVDIRGISKLVITGAGELNVSNQYMQAICVDGVDISIEGGAKVTATAYSDREAVRLYSGKLQVKGEGSKLTATSSSTSYSAIVLAGISAASDFSITSPAGATISGSGTTYEIFNSNGTRANHVVLEPITETYLGFSTYPEVINKVIKGGEATTLTVKAAIVNYTGTEPEFSYQWYLNGEAIAGATTATYSYSTAKAGRDVLRCDATATIDTVPYKATGDDICMDCNVRYTSLGIEEYTSSSDKLDTEGWKWDKDTKTLTIDGLYIIAKNNGLGLYTTGDSKIIINGENYVEVSSSYNGAFRVGGGSGTTSKVTVSGGGTLTTKTNDSNAYCEVREGTELVLTDGVKLNLNAPSYSSGYGALYVKSGGSLRLEDAGTQLNLNGGSGNRVAIRFVDEPQRYAFEISDPTGGSVKMPSGYSFYTVCDSAGKAAGEVSLVADTTVALGFDTYPKAEYTAVKNTALSLSAVAQMKNYTGTPTINYQWYLDGEAITGATGADYAFTPATNGIYTLRCDASATVEMEGVDTDFTATGKDIKVSVGIRTTTLNIGNDTESTDMLATEGWKWDKNTKTLILENVNINTTSGRGLYIYVSGDVTVNMPAGSKNYITATSSATGSTPVAFTSSTVTFNGPGELFTSGKNSNNYFAAYTKMILDNGAYIQGENTGKGGAAFIFDNELVIADADSRIKATIPNSSSNNPIIFRSMQEAGNFEAETPAGAELALKSAGTYVFMKDSIAVKDITLRKDTRKYIAFTKYPEDTTCGTGSSITLTAKAKTVNLGDTEITYTWYDGNGKVLGTGADYTFKAGSTPSFETLYCEITASYDGTDYQVTGDKFAVFVGGIEKDLLLSDMATTDKLSSEGWKWNASTKTLTLKNFAARGRIELPGGSTINLTDGGMNYLYSTNQIAITAKGEGLTFNGTGKLNIYQKLTYSVKASAIWCGTNSSVAPVTFNGSDIEISRTGPTTSEMIDSWYIYFNAANVKMNWVGEHDTSRFMDRVVMNGSKLAEGTESYSSYYGTYHADTDMTTLQVVPDGIYIKKQPEEEVYGIKKGQELTLTAQAVSANEGTISYKWYSTDDYSSPADDASTKLVAKTAKLTITGKERGGKYYFCEISDGTTTATTKIVCVVTGAAGKLPITEKLVLSETVDNLATHGWKWDSASKTLTLSSAEVFIPFGKTSYWMNMPAEITFSVVKGTTNHVQKGLYIQASQNYTATFTGEGTLDMDRIYGSGSYVADVNVTGGIKLSSGRLDAKTGSALTVDDGAYAEFNSSRSDFHGTVTVENAELYFSSYANYNDDEGDFVVKNGGTVKTDGSLTTYGDMKIETGGMLQAEGTVRVGNSSNYREAKLTIDGTLLVNCGGSPLMIDTTLSGEEALNLSDAVKVFTPETYTIYNGDVVGEKTIQIGRDASSVYTGVLYIAPVSTKPIPLTSVKLVGTPKYGERLTYVTEPADAVIEEFEFETSYSKNGPWSTWSSGSSTYQDISTRMVDRYVRVKATAIGTHSGTVYSEVLGPVKGNPATLKELLINDSSGWAKNNFDGDDDSYYRSVYAESDEVFYERYWAVPVSNDAKITMKVVNDAYPDGLEFTGAVADIPMILGDNTVTVTVTYQGQTNEYTVSTGVYMNYTSFSIYNYVPGVTVTAVLDYTDPAKADETMVNDGISTYTNISNVPYDTKITLTAVTPEGKRLWNYNSDLLAADDGNNTCEYRFGESAYAIYIREENVIAKAPAGIEAYWDSFVDDKQTSNAIVNVEALEKSDAAPGEYGYYNIHLEAFDALTGEVATEYDTADDGAGPGAGETAIRCVLYGLDPSRDYTIRASYNELMTNYAREEAATESQYAVATLEGVPENIQMIPDKEHIVLAPGETTEISFEFDGLTDSYIELMSSTDEEVVELYGGYMSDSDDYKKGTITAGAKEGTTWLTFGGKVQNIYGVGFKYAYATVRVDVSAKEEAGNLHLGVKSGSINVYSDSAITVPVYQMDSRYEIVNAVFVTPEDPAKAEAINEKFEIQTVNDRTLKIVPKVPADSDSMNWSKWANSMKGTYKANIQVNYKEGTDSGGNPIIVYSRVSSEKLTITATATAPAVKVKDVKFNSFYQNQVKDVVYTIKGKTVTEAKVDMVKNTAKIKACPDWMSLDAGGKRATLSSEKIKALKNKASGTLYLKVWVDGYRVPAQVTAEVSAAYATPKLKLSKSTVNLAADGDNVYGYDMKLQSNDKKVSYSSLNVTGLRVAKTSDMALLSAKDRKTYAASSEVYVGNFDAEKGTFTLYANDKPVAGKALLIATLGDDSRQEVKIPLTIKLVKAPILKASATEVTLNTAVGTGYWDKEEKVVKFSTNTQGYDLTYSNVDYFVTDAKGVDDLSAELGVEEENGQVTFYALDTTVKNKAYKVHVTAGGIKEKVVITVTAKDILPTLKVSKSKISLRRAWGTYEDEQAIKFTTTNKNYKPNVLSEEIQVMNPDGKVMGAGGTDDTLHYYMGWSGSDKVLYVTPGSNCAAGKYKVKINHKMPCGKLIKATVNVTVNDNLPVVKLGTSTVKLNTAITDLYDDSIYGGTYFYNSAVVKVKGLENVDVYTHNHTVKDSKGKNASSAVTVVKGSSELKVRLTSDAKAGETYTVSYYAELEAKNAKGKRLQTKPVTLTVKAVKAPTVSGKVTGNIDLTRADTTKANFNLKYTGWSKDAYEGYQRPVLKWEVYAKSGTKPITSAQGSLGSGTYGEGLVAYGDSNDEGSGWFKNAVNLEENPYDLSLMVSKSGTSGWELNQINPTYKYTCRVWLEFPAEITRDESDTEPMKVSASALAFVVKQGTTKFSQSPKSVTLAKLDPYGRCYITIKNSDKDKQNVEDVASVQLQSSALANALEVVKVHSAEGNKYAVQWKDTDPVTPGVQIKSGVVSGEVKLKVFLEGNDPARNAANATLKLKVTVK